MLEKEFDKKCYHINKIKMKLNNIFRTKDQFSVSVQNREKNSNLERRRKTTIKIIIALILGKD